MKVLTMSKLPNLCLAKAEARADSSPSPPQDPQEERAGERRLFVLACLLLKRYSRGTRLSECIWP
jgi:hypothetical protein